MNENERLALAAYRTSLGAKQPEQARDWSRLVGKIEAGAQPLSVDLEPRRRRGWIAWGVGAAAAVLLAAWAWPRSEAAQGDEGSDASQAAYEVEGRASSAVARPQPEPVRGMGARPGPSIPGAPAAELEVVPDVIPQQPARPESDPMRRQPRIGKGTKPVTEVSETQDVVAEAKALRAIRASLRDQHPGQALRLLRRYLSRFPTGALRDEATLLRADALCLDGQPERARDVAARFVRTHPKSPLTARARGVCREP